MGIYSKQYAGHIQDGIINDSIAAWHGKQGQRVQTCATPSTLTDCPRTVWLRYVKQIPAPIPMGWGKAQRMLHGRLFENTIADQLKAEGHLLYHWRDNFEGESKKFEMGEGLTKVAGTPDLLIKLYDGKIAISDAKTSMSSSFGYIPLNPEQVFKDYYWYKYKLQLTAYFMLCHKNKEFFEELPLPEVCHLFSYALDDGVNRREFTWRPTKEDFEEVKRYAIKWNTAFNSETMPECTCNEDAVKFCYYVQEQMTTRTGAKIGIRCCGEDLVSNEKESVSP
jgi:predicted SprT family Zn-dependent metalloprotease